MLADGHVPALFPAGDGGLMKAQLGSKGFLSREFGDDAIGLGHDE